MKLLFDQNLSPRLVERLSDLFPGSRHVGEENLQQATDAQIWSLAGKQGYTVVSKDRDFSALALRLGPPPKAVWIGVGNCSTRTIEARIREAAGQLIDFGEEETPLLVLR